MPATSPPTRGFLKTKEIEGLIGGNRSSGISPPPLEISDPDSFSERNIIGSPSKSSSYTKSGWKSFVVERLSLRNMITKHKTLLLGILVLFLLALHNITHNEEEKLVAPITGEAYLTPNEFLNIRTAQPHESVLITGGLGFIGSHVVDLLLHRGFKVTILDDESNGHNHNSYVKNEMVPNDITVVTDFPQFQSPAEEKNNALDGYFTHVIHLAAAISVAESMTNPDKYEKVNYGGSQIVLDWIYNYNQALGSSSSTESNNSEDVDKYYIRKVVAASSAAIYGDPDPSLLPLQESAGYGGKSGYADTKYRMEGLMQDFVTKQNNNDEDAQSKYSTSAVALRFFNVYGPRQDPKNPYSGVISLFLERAMLGNDITILGDGEMTRDFIYVKDVARAIVLSMLQEEKDDDAASFAVYNVCTGKSITINTLATQIKTSMESNSEITHLEPRDGDIRDSQCNPTAAKKGIGFVSAVNQEGGLEKTARWFKET